MGSKVDRCVRKGGLDDGNDRKDLPCELIMGAYTEPVSMVSATSFPRITYHSIAVDTRHAAGPRSPARSSPNPSRAGTKRAETGSSDTIRARTIYSCLDLGIESQSADPKWTLHVTCSGTEGEAPRTLIDRPPCAVIMLSTTFREFPPSYCHAAGTISRAGAGWAE